MSENKKVNNVEHPIHYADTCSIECIQAMSLVFGDIGTCYFCLTNAFKYMWRYKNKNGEEDLDKTKWYLNYCENIMTMRNVESSRINELLERLRNLYMEIIAK